MGIQELADDHEASSAVRGVSFSRVRDWKGQTWYTTCAEPLQSPTDVALERMICRTMEERPNKDSRKKDEDVKSPNISHRLLRATDRNHRSWETIDVTRTNIFVPVVNVCTLIGIPLRQIRRQT